MPNHITNRLVIKADDELKAKILSDIQGLDAEGNIIPIDFNKIVPMPESLNVTSGSPMSDGLALAKHEAGMALTDSELDCVERVKSRSQEEQAKILELGKKGLDNKKKYGFCTWYSWRCNFWGTKWNAYSHHEEEDGLYFETAWSMPNEIYIALSKKYPEAVFEVVYADEDISYNCGRVDYQDGEIIFSEIPEGGSNEAYEICFELNVAIEEDYELVEGHYQYKEDEDE